MADGSLCGGNSCAVLGGCSYREFRVQDFGLGWVKHSYNFQRARYRKRKIKAFGPFSNS